MHAFGAGDRFLPLNLPRQRLERRAYASAAIRRPNAPHPRRIALRGRLRPTARRHRRLRGSLAPGAPVETFAVHVYRKWAPLDSSDWWTTAILMDAPSSASSTIHGFGINGDAAPVQGRWRTHTKIKHARRITCARRPESRRRLPCYFGDNSRLDRGERPPVEEGGHDRQISDEEPGPRRARSSPRRRVLAKEFPELSKIVSAPGSSSQGRY